MEKAVGKKRVEKVEEEIADDDIIRKKLLTEEQEILLNKMSIKANKHKPKLKEDIISKNIKIAFKWKEISFQKMVNSKDDFSRKLEEVKANNRRLYLQNLKKVFLLIIFQNSNLFIIEETLLGKVKQYLINNLDGILYESREKKLK